MQKLFVFLALVHIIFLGWFHALPYKFEEKIAHLPLGWLQHRYAFLTIISFTLNTLYFCVNSFRPLSRRASNFYLSLVKIALYVCIMFWLIYLKDPKLVVGD